MAPLKIISWELINESAPQQRIEFLTEQGISVCLDKAHALHLRHVNQEDYPVVHIRDQLHALVARNVYYQLMELVEEIDVQANRETLFLGALPKTVELSSSVFALRSSGQHFPLVPHG